jgi:hypothetical protein
MLHVQEGQCGLCTHFGEIHVGDIHVGDIHAAEGVLTQIRSSKEAKEDFVDDCGHPRHASLHLRVTAVSGCDGFEPVKH